MINHMLDTVLITSITALIILGIKSLLSCKIAFKWQFALWIILAVRLVFPMLPESHLSLFNAVPQCPALKVSKSFSESMSNQQTSISMPLMTEQVNQRTDAPLLTIENSFFIIWLMGLFVLVVYLIGTYFYFYLQYKKFKLAEENEILEIFQSCKEQLKIKRKIPLKIGGSTPLLKGLLKPQIIIPEGYTNAELYGIFLHELIHYKFKDVWWTILSMLIICVYWYNPILWYALFLFRRDMEMLCDWRVLQVYPDRKQYASVLLKTALQKNQLVLGTTAFSNRDTDIAKRIKSIALFKKPRKAGTIIGIISIICVAVVCLSNPIVKKGPESDEKKLETAYTYKKTYIGDASNASQLAGSLYFSEYKTGIELQTQKRPYGMTIHYQAVPERLSQQGAAGVTEDMLKNASLIFCLIDNVDEVTLKFEPDDKEGYTFLFKRRFFNSIFGRDIRTFAASSDIFKKQFIPLLLQRDWEGSIRTYNQSLGNVSETDDVLANKIERNLQIIESSPASSSNPMDYIHAHPYEYEDIVKMGDKALQYMLSEFQQGKTNDLNAHIMMHLCIDILGDRNNVPEGSYQSPEEWYKKLKFGTTAVLPQPTAAGREGYEKMVYAAALNHYQRFGDTETVTFVAPHIFGTYKSKDTLRIFATVYYSSLKLYDKTFKENSAEIVPAAIIYKKNKAGQYVFNSYVEAMDGSYFEKSIRAFCKPRSEMADAILKHYSDYSDLFEMMHKNLISYCKENHLSGIMLKESSGESIPLT